MLPQKRSAVALQQELEQKEEARAKAEIESCLTLKSEWYQALKHNSSSVYSHIKADIASDYTIMKLENYKGTCVCFVINYTRNKELVDTIEAILCKYGIGSFSHPQTFVSFEQVWAVWYGMSQFSKVRIVNEQIKNTIEEVTQEIASTEQSVDNELLSHEQACLLISSYVASLFGINKQTAPCSDPCHFCIDYKHK
jgi:hypothetical protein